MKARSKIFNNLLAALLAIFLPFSSNFLNLAEEVNSSNFLASQPVKAPRVIKVVQAMPALNSLQRSQLPLLLSDQGVWLWASR